MNPNLGNVFAGLAVATGLVFGLIFAASALLPVALAYVALRVQDARHETPDPKLGLKTAFHTIHTAAVLLVLGGLSALMVDAMRDTLGGGAGRGAPRPAPAARAQDGPNETQRVAAALIASGALFGGGFWALLVGTNDGSRRAVRRVFVGGRLALCLLVTLFTFTLLLVNLFQKEADASMTEAMLALLIVWAPAGVVHLLLFALNTAEPRERRGSDDRDRDRGRGWRPED
ncbi:MAG: hypothetical protein C0501_14865 [Isosphaera sp.]|nr:hypothetical protein [Isosphaera sp.]